MATDEAELGGRIRTAEARSQAPMLPYSPSWIDLIIRWIDRLPGPTWAFYLVAIGPSIVVANSANWLSGLVPVGTLTPTQTFWGVWTVGAVWVMHHLNGVAGSAFDAYRPAISSAPFDLELARYELIVIPARPALIMAGLAVPFTLGYYAGDPSASGIVGLSPAGLAVRAVDESFSSAIILVLIYHAFRQLRSVNQLHASADHIDPFRPAPLHAFSRLTAQTGAVLIGIITLGLVGNPVPADEFVRLYLPWIILCSVMAIAVFVVPLLGMHRRIAEEKGRLQGAAEDRLQSILAELNRDVDGLELGRADGLNKLLSSQLQQRDILARLSTWPWSTGTLRGFATTLLLPMGLFLAQQALSRIF